MDLLIGTAGHIDHGKSALIELLSGSHPSHLPEEIKRAMTIELGFSHLLLEDHSISFIDVPGHADFVNNMVMGVGCLDIVLFVVAADDGWMPQSEEHLHIIDYLGVKNAIIALTKADLAEDIDFSIALLADELKGTSLENTPIIPVSSKTKKGLNSLKQALLSCIQNLTKRPENHIARLHVDRVFSPTGIGTVITGSLTGNLLKKGEKIYCYPEKLPAHIRHIQHHSHSCDYALPYKRTALNIPDIAIARAEQKGVKRGNLLSPSDALEPTSTLDVYLYRNNRAIPGQAQTQHPLKNTQKILLYHGSTKISARLILQEDKTLFPGEKSYAQIRLDTPLTACLGDYFILRDTSQQATLAGGIILDTQSQRRQWRTPQRMHFLQARRQALHSPKQLILSSFLLHETLKAQAPLLNTPFRSSSIQEALKELEKNKDIIIINGLCLLTQSWNTYLQQASDAILTYHQTYPDRFILPLLTWRDTLKKLRIPSEFIAAIQSYLCSGDTPRFALNQQGIYALAHLPTLPNSLQQEAERLCLLFKKQGLSPLPLTEIDADAKVLSFLIAKGKLIELDNKVILYHTCYTQAVEKIITLLKKEGKAKTSTLRAHLNTSRKIALPLLESLDKRELTQRDGDFRFLGNASL